MSNSVLNNYVLKSTMGNFAQASSVNANYVKKNEFNQTTLDLYNLTTYVQEIKEQANGIPGYKLINKNSYYYLQLSRSNQVTSFSEFAVLQPSKLSQNNRCALTVQSVIPNNSTAYTYTTISNLNLSGSSYNIIPQSTKYWVSEYDYVSGTLKYFNEQGFYPSVSRGIDFPSQSLYRPIFYLENYPYYSYPTSYSGRGGDLFSISASGSSTSLFGRSTQGQSYLAYSRFIEVIPKQNYSSNFRCSSTNNNIDVEAVQIYIKKELLDEDDLIHCRYFDLEKKQYILPTTLRNNSTYLLHGWRYFPQIFYRNFSTVFGNYHNIDVAYKIPFISNGETFTHIVLSGFSTNDSSNYIASTYGKLKMSYFNINTSFVAPVATGTYLIQSNDSLKYNYFQGRYATWNYFIGEGKIVDSNYTTITLQNNWTTAYASTKAAIAMLSFFVQDQYHSIWK